MKFKGLILSGLLLVSVLCGCSVDSTYDYDDSLDSGKIAVNPQAKAVIDEVEAVLMNSEYDMDDTVRDMLNRDFERVDSVEFVQHSNGREVQIYRSRSLPALYVLYDGEWLEWIEPKAEELTSCGDVYTALKEGGICPTDYIAGDGDTDAIVSENEEFSLMSFNGGSMFSVTYDDVDAYSEDMPVKTIVYCTDGKPVRAEFIYVRLKGDEEMSDNNIQEVSAVFTALGLGEESSSLAGELADSPDKASYSRTDGALTVSSYKNAARDKDIAYNIFAVDF